MSSSTLGLLSLILISSLAVVNYAYKRDAKDRIEANLKLPNGFSTGCWQPERAILPLMRTFYPGTLVFARAIASGDKNTLLSALDNLLDRICADAAMLVSLDYQLIADTAHPDRQGVFFATHLIKLAKTPSGINTIEQSGQHLLGLINEILELSKIEAGKLELHITDLNLHGLLENICEIMRARAEAKGLEFSCEGLSSVPKWVQSDEKRLRQVLLKLVTFLPNEAK